jgi:hypothetical protein
MVELQPILDVLRNDPRVHIIELDTIKASILQFQFKLLARALILLPVQLLPDGFRRTIFIELINRIEHQFIQTFRALIVDLYAVKPHYLYVDVVFFQQNV